MKNLCSVEEWKYIEVKTTVDPDCRPSTTLAVLLGVGNLHPQNLQAPRNDQKILRAEAAEVL